jgi:hypothetical protein
MSMSNRILKITTTIELPDDEFARASVVAKVTHFSTTFRQMLQDAGVEGTVTHDFVTKRAPKATTDVKLAAE